ncbi:TlpA family protein disulfide reductase [Aurantiacibacter aquimixticola]|uniref:TlpA family protein disulfide reductase n=2 Tax=Aurantiacibacter aquimixticola TaxID=1958945 RepID=A0A419RWE0_9SPHN|nr:TlpA family protein disulfide reductase [Aurantiacibacter aquimixticola]
MLAACDTGAEEEAQETVAAADESEAIDLTGTLLRDFAGERIPAVTVIDPDGARLDLRDVDGPVLMNLWATWCRPCVVEMPLLDELAADLEGEVRVLTVSADLKGAEVVQPFFDRYELPNLPRWMDSGNDLANAFDGGPLLPLTVLYDAEGREVWRITGAYDWASASAREEVREALSVEAGDAPDTNPSVS